MKLAYPYGAQFHSPYDRPDLVDQLVESGRRAGTLLADVALQRFGSVIEALAWVQWTWRSAPLADIDRHTQDAARTALLDRASAAERACWQRIVASDTCASLEDVRWWLDIEAPKLLESLTATPDVQHWGIAA
ncbi:MAG: hypothetical protein K2R93_12550 [Gemmatimonadaceae bacterium]|nr:hypothetical protein [Gemmatimonadaceae bacterium]